MLSVIGSPRQPQLILFSLGVRLKAFWAAKGEASFCWQSRSRQSECTDELTSFRIACRERDFRAFCHWPRGASGQTSAGNSRNLPNTDVGQRGRAYNRCHIEYLDVATFLRSELNCSGRARTTRSSSNC
jgi:hypothetical protein